MCESFAVSVQIEHTDTLFFAFARRNLLLWNSQCGNSKQSVSICQCVDVTGNVAANGCVQWQFLCVVNLKFNLNSNWRGPFSARNQWIEFRGELNIVCLPKKRCANCRYEIFEIFRPAFSVLAIILTFSKRPSIHWTQLFDFPRLSRCNDKLKLCSNFHRSKSEESQFLLNKSPNSIHSISNLVFMHRTA